MTHFPTRRGRRLLAVATASSIAALAGAIASPAQAQVYVDVIFAPEEESPLCLYNFELSVSQDDECGAHGPAGEDPGPPVKGLGFGSSDGHFISYLDADGKAYLNNHTELNGDTLVTGDFEIQNGVRVYGLLDSYDGIDNAGGLTNRDGLTNHGGITNTGGFTSSGAFVNNASFTNNGNLTVRDKLSTDTFAANSMEIAGYAVIGAHLTGNNGASFTDLTDTYDFYASHSLRALAGAVVDLGGNRVQNVGTPTAATDAANKGYVDAMTSGAMSAASHAQATADTALANAAMAQDTADTALANAATAQGTANTALANAATAQRTADLAVVKEDNQGRDTASALGGGAAYDPATGHVTAPSYAVGTASYASVGAALNAANTGGLAYFHANTTKADGSATGTDAVAIGPASSAGGAGAFAAGNGANASANGAVAVGQGAQATGVNAIAIGNGAKATGSVAVGVAASAANGGAAYGDRSTATGVNAIALGSDASATADNAVALGSGSVATVVNTVSVGTTASQRRIVNVAAGVAPTDAATVAQLAAGSASVATALGGGSVASAGGVVSAPSYVLDGTTYRDVGSALTGLSDRVDGVVALSYDIRKEERRGIAAATAMANAPMPSAPGRTSWAANTAVFHGEVAFGGSLAHRFDTGSDESLAVTAGFAYAPGGNSVAKVGMAGEF